MPVRFARCTPSIQKVRLPLFAPAALDARQSISTKCGASLMVNQLLVVQVLLLLTSAARS